MKFKKMNEKWPWYYRLPRLAFTVFGVNYHLIPRIDAEAISVSEKNKVVAKYLCTAEDFLTDMKRQKVKVIDKSFSDLKLAYGFTGFDWMGITLRLHPADRFIKKFVKKGYTDLTT